MNPLSIDSGSKEQIDKTLGELWEQICHDKIARQLLSIMLLSNPHTCAVLIVQSPADSHTCNYVGI